MLTGRSVSAGKALRQGAALWLLLLSILTHTVVPAGSPLVPTSGSAFSAATAEVAIPPKRETASSEQAVAGGGEDGGSKGGSLADDPPAPFPAEAASIPWPPERAKSPSPEPWTTDRKGGAAPFSARAPPSI
jgi:hypothetical protein